MCPPLGKGIFLNTLRKNMIKGKKIKRKKGEQKEKREKRENNNKV